MAKYRIKANVNYFFTVDVPDNWAKPDIFEALEELEFENVDNYGGTEFEIVGQLGSGEVDEHYKPVYKLSCTDDFWKSQ